MIWRNVNGEPLMDSTLSQVLTRLFWLEEQRTLLVQENVALRRRIEDFETQSDPAVD